jgi:hypothetical protein
MSYQLDSIMLVGVSLGAVVDFNYACRRVAG